MLMYVPADLPEMPPIDESVLSSSDYGPPLPEGHQPWTMKKLTPSADDETDNYKIRDLIEDFKKLNPNFMEWLKCLPCDDIINFKIHRQDKTGGVPLHVDLLQPMRDIMHYHHLYFNEPCGYRIIMNGKRKDTTYLIGPDGDKVYCNMPETGTNTYIMNYTTGIHGVEEDPGRSILFLQFNINTIKHEKIVKNSVTKYNDYAVRFTMDKKYG